MFCLTLAVRAGASFRGKFLMGVATGAVMRAANWDVKSVIAPRRRASTSALASSMLSTTLGMRRPTRLRGLKRAPRSRSSQKVLVTLQMSY